MPQNRVDLANVFQTVTQNLAQNQQALNRADAVNQDHGDNMVQTFQTITAALQEKKGKSDSAALAYAARKLEASTKSSSGQLYAQGLAQAATQFKGKQVDSRGAMDLLQTLIGGGQSPQSGGQAAGGDMLGALLGGMAGGQQPQSQSGGESAGGDMLGALLGGMAGEQQPQSQSGGDMLGALLGGLAGGGSAKPGGGLSDGLDVGDLLTAGMGYLQAKQSGSSNVQALMQAFMAVSRIGNSEHRQQSTGLVVNSFLQALGSASTGR
jgi:hypothetical protein